MNRKKIIGILLISTLLVTTLVGCGSTNKSTTSNDINKTTSKKTITILTWGDDTDMKKIIDSGYVAYPELKDKYDVQITIGGKSDAEVAQKLRLQLASKTDVPDIVEFNRSNISEFVEAGVLSDITSEVSPYKGNMLPGAIQLSTYKDKIIGFPYEIKTKLWFYRKDMFDAAGIDPNSIRNVDDLIAAGKKLQVKYPKSYIWNIGPQNAAYNLGMIISGNGAKFSDDKGNYIVSSDPGIKKTFEAFRKLKDSGVVAPIVDWTPDWEKAFADGTITSSLTGNWMKFFLPKYAAGQNGKWAVTQFPIIADSVGGSEAGGSMFVVPKDAKNNKDAIDFFSKIFLTKQGNLAMRKEVGHESWTPVLTDAINDPSVAVTDAFFGGSLHEAEVKAMDTYKVFNFSPASATEFTIMNQYLDKYINNRGSLEDNLKGAEKDMTTQIGNPFKRN